MPTVTCEVNIADFGKTMTDMRQWIDHNRSDVLDFQFDVYRGNRIIVRLEFGNDRDASEFAAAFEDELSTTMS